jgi:anhydro-N-acetylmuramic acid kinase
LFCGNSVKEFIKTNHIHDVEYIASHGHTVFHQPESGFSLQIGSGAVIAATSQIKTICDFRSGDVANLGQGAPLVPIGDKLLFSEYYACLNLGGFSNISYDINNNRIAYDICPANIVLNHFAKYYKQEYDKNGSIAKTGELIEELYNELNTIEYYQKATPKSLGREWLEKHFMPIISKYDKQNKNNILYSLVEHISYQISNELKDKENCLVTGGGAFNTFLIEQIQKKTACKLVIPDSNIVSFKEALIFAFLGYLRNIEEINCLASYTGARKDSCIGAIYLP